MDVRLFGEVFVTLLVIMDPPGAVPIFLGLTRGRAAKERARLALQAVLAALAVIVAFALFGQQILEYLGVTLPALQAAGGLLLLLVALELLTGKIQEPSAEADVNVALVPLATPLLAGPGAIVAVMVFVQRSEEPPDFVALAVGILAVMLILWLVLRFSNVVLRLLRESGVSLISRIAGLLLAAIAVQLVADAVFAFAAQ